MVTFRNPLQHKISVLVDKGHSAGWAMSEAMNDQKLEDDGVPDDGPETDCTICFRNFKPRAWKYHYHPCE